MNRKAQTKPKSMQSHSSAKSGERVPLHRKIRDGLRAEIESGQRPPYSELPAEQELANRFETTRMTVRQAITALEIEGLIEKQQGRRTIVSPPKQVEPIFVLPHDNQDFFRRRENINYRLLTQDLVAPPKNVREALELPWTIDRIVCVSRVRVMHDVPISWYSTYVSSTPEAMQKISNENIEGRSFLHTLRTTYNLIPERMVHEMEVLSADEETCTLLDVKERTPILKVESIEYNEKDVPFSQNIEYFRADRYRFQMNMSNQHKK